MSQYWDTVRAIAEEIHEEYPDQDRDHEERVNLVHEAVDSSGWIIYYADNETVLEETHNEPDNREVASMARPDGGWKDFRQVAAYLAMEGDVWEALRDLDEHPVEQEAEEE